MTIFPSRPPELTERQYEIIVRLAQGETNDDIAEILDISTRTVREYIGRLCRRYECAPELLPEKALGMPPVEDSY